VYAAVEEAHADIGSMVADAWQLSDYLSAVITTHHDLEKADPLTRIVAIVSLMDEMRTNPAHRDGSLPLVQSLARTLELSQAQLGELELELKKAASLSMKL
jgi:HD-like signal output (HDOD) protein